MREREGSADGERGRGREGDAGRLDRHINVNEKERQGRGGGGTTVSSSLSPLINTSFSRSFYLIFYFLLTLSFLLSLFPHPLSPLPIPSHAMPSDGAKKKKVEAAFMQGGNTLLDFLW
jgi:hypothetical protein